MANAPVKKLLAAIHKINEELDHIAEEGTVILQEMAGIDYTSITDPVKMEELTMANEALRKNFLAVHDLKQPILRMLQLKVLKEMRTGTPSRTRSLTRSPVRVTRRRTPLVDEGKALTV
jgi:hypothetical protein